jgi:Holliday junction resolvase RusA-like endonuclease
MKKNSNCDVLNGIIYSDDGKIVRKNNIFKCYSMEPGVFIKLKGEL